MNLAIEYLLRDKRARDYLTVPCSLFLTTGSGHKLVLTVHKVYGGDHLMVKHWKTWLAKPECKLPPCEEFSVPRADIFSSPHVVLGHCAIMPYEAAPYASGRRQHADPPMAVEQEREYDAATATLYNSAAHQTRRLEWLWDAFQAVYVGNDLACENLSQPAQREVVRFYSRPVWFIWQYWRRHLLDYRTPVATELVFRREYVSQESPSRRDWSRELIWV